MLASNQSSTVFIAGSCEWRSRERVLLVRGQEVKVPWRVSECLLALMEAGGEVVTREDLQTRIWGGALMEDSNLAHTVAALRKAIDPAPDGSSHIETIPRIGYRLSAPVTVKDAEPAEVAVESERPPSPAAKPRWQAMAFAAVGAVASLAILLSYRWYSAEDRRQSEAVARTALISMRLGTVKGYQEARSQLDSAESGGRRLPLLKAARAELAARSGEAGFGPALDMARKAVAEDPECVECRAILGYMLVTREWNWSEGEAHLEKAARSSEASSQARLWYAQLLAVTRRLQLAHKQLDIALAGDESNHRLHIMRGLLYYLDKDVERSGAELRKANTLDSSSPVPFYWMYRAAILRDDAESAAANWAKHYSRYSNFNTEQEHNVRGQWVGAVETHGKAGLMGRMLHESKETEAARQLRYERATLKLWNGDRAGALTELEEAEKSRPFNLIYVAADPVFEPLHGEERFRALLARLKLPSKS